MSKKADLLFFIITIAMAAVLWIVPRYFSQVSGTIAVVSIAGEEYGRYDLSQDCMVSLPGAEGGYNVLVISDQSAAISDADCADQLCVRQKSIAGQGGSIVCLPHKLVVRIERGKKGEPDAITY